MIIDILSLKTYNVCEVEPLNFNQGGNIMTKRKYEWFLEPQDSHTNEVISKNVGDENFSIDIVCTDGQKRTFWQCPSGLVLMLWRSRSNLNIKLKIFGREGKNGKIRDVTFLFKYESGGTRNKRSRTRRIYGKF